MIKVLLKAIQKWPTEAGPPPDIETLIMVAGWLNQIGTMKHLALAMLLRPAGATQPEIIAATGGYSVTVGRPSSDCRDGHQVYALEPGQ